MYAVYASVDVGKGQIMCIALFKLTCSKFLKPRARCNKISLEQLIFLTTKKLTNGILLVN